MDRLLLASMVLASIVGAVIGSTCSDEGGTCMNVNSCSSKTVPGLCPGATNIQCCYPHQGDSCSVPSVGSGTCLVEGRQVCSGSFYSNHCSGPTKVKCCVTKPSSGGQTDWAAKESLPARTSVNKGWSTLSTSAAGAFFGKPCATPQANCPGTGSNAPSSKLKRNLATKKDSAAYSVIPLSSGSSMVKPAMDALARIFTRVKADRPDLVAAVKGGSPLCCRYMRPTTGEVSTSFSLHAYGLALDLTIGNKPYDDGKDPRTTYKGIIVLVPYFNAEGFFWGGGFSPSYTDAMHFEVSKEKFDEWKKNGLLA